MKTIEQITQDVIDKENISAQFDIYNNFRCRIVEVKVGDISDFVAVSYMPEDIEETAQKISDLVEKLMRHKRENS